MQNNPPPATPFGLTPASAKPAPGGPPPNLDSRGLPHGYPFKPDWEVTPRQVRDLMRQPADTRPILLDCRRHDEWQVARIDGAILIPMGDVERRLDELEHDSAGRTHPIIVHCHHGRRSMNVTTQLRALGFTNVMSMAGGIDLWSVDIDPTVRRY